MNDIDLKPLKIGKKKAGAKIARTDSEINYARRQGTLAERKITAGQNRAHQGADHQLIAKIARENEVAPPPKISQDVGQIMQTARKEYTSHDSNGLSQKDLAQKVNEKPSVIQAYESGTAIPNHQILSKLERVLNVKLRGSDKGKPLRKKPEPVAAPAARGA